MAKFAIGRAHGSLVSRAMIVSLSIMTSLHLPLMAQDAETPYDRYMRTAQASFDSGKYLMAEKTWRRALVLAKKEGDDTKTVNAMIGIGKSLAKEEKFSLANDMYQQALEIDKQKNIDPSPVNAQIVELSAVYKPIQWTGAREDVNRFLNDVGIASAYATRDTTTEAAGGIATTHVNASLTKKWTRTTAALYKEYGPKNAAGSTDTAAGAVTLPDNNPVKQIKLDKVITFDIIRDSSTKYRVTNIKGISANVGLWVKIAEILLDVDEQNKPFAAVRAGTMGVSKTERVKMPLEAFNQLKDGVDQIDPFVTVVAKTPIETPSSTTSIEPSSATSAVRSPSTSTVPASAQAPSTTALPPTTAPPAADIMIAPSTPPTDPADALAPSPTPTP